MEMKGRSCFLANALEVGQARHLGLVLGDDLAEHAGRRQPGGAAQVDRRLGVPGALEHAARSGSAAGRCGRAGSRSLGRVSGSISAAIVAARSVAEMPVVVPWR